MAVKEHRHFMARALSLAERSLQSGGFPVGAVLVCDGIEIASGMSSTELLGDVTAHAEVQAIRAAGTCPKGSLTLYSSLEPCLMCLTASFWAGVSQIIIGCRRDLVSPEYYEGSMGVDAASSLLRAPPQIVVFDEFSPQVLALIVEFERKSHAAET